MTGIIYCWTNNNTNKKYIGQTIHPEQRKRSHIHEAFVRGSDYYFHRSLRKHGLDVFSYEILEDNVSRELLNDRENHYINEYNTIWPNGYNETLANSLSISSISKMSETKKRQWKELPEETKKQRIEQMTKVNIGAKRSSKTKQKMSESAKAYLKANPRPKRVWTQEMKNRQSEILKEKYSQGIGRWAKS